MDKNSFIDKWHLARERTGSNIVAGLDPALFEMGKGESGLPEGADLRSWCLSFIRSVAPYVSVIKFNQGFFQGEGQRTLLRELVEATHGLDLLAMSDNKFADIGNTNEAWIYTNHSLGFDAVTCAPYAGNIEDCVEVSHSYGLGVIPMGLMSNPEYKTEMNFKHPETGESLWHSRVRRCIESGADAITVGGTYTTDDIEFVQCIEMTSDSDMLYLIPGIGSQGGDVQTYLASGIDRKKCMISSSRAVMFPSGSNSAPEEQAAAAKRLRDQFNQVST